MVKYKLTQLAEVIITVEADSEQEALERVLFKPFHFESSLPGAESVEIKFIQPKEDEQV